MFEVQPTMPQAVKTHHETLMPNICETESFGIGDSPKERAPRCCK
jgi:hypothetical protein